MNCFVRVLDLGHENHRLIQTLEFNITTTIADFKDEVLKNLYKDDPSVTELKIGTVSGKLADTENVFSLIKGPCSSGLFLVHVIRSK